MSEWGDGTQGVAYMECLDGGNIAGLHGTQLDPARKDEFTDACAGAGEDTGHCGTWPFAGGF